MKVEGVISMENYLNENFGMKVEGVISMENYLNENFGDAKGKNLPEEAIQFNPKGIFRFNPIRRPFQILTLAAEAIRHLPTLAAEAIRRPIQDTMEQYKQVEYLGHGRFGEVWLVENKKTIELFAMKCIQRGHQIDKYLAIEIIIQKSLYHPNVIQFKEVVLSSTCLCIVMEYTEGGDLHDKIFKNNSKKGLDENTARYYFQQLISGVFYCHTKEMCHRDLKPENILLDGSDPPCLKICDFGFSKKYRMHLRPKSAVGTPQYSAPEVCSREYDGKLADLWSCGVILYTMLVGEHPNYRPNDTGETSNVYKTNACPFSLPDSLSPDSKDLLAHMLVVDPRKRIAIEEIMKHRWFKKKLKGKLAEAFQVTKENPRFALQSDEEIVIIVEEAKIPPPEDANGTEEDVESEEEEEDEDSSCGSCGSQTKKLCTYFEL